MPVAKMEQDLLVRISKIGQFSSNGIRAPHKPLLLLLAISKAGAGEERRILFSDEEGRLKTLLELAGNTSARPEYPFFYLKNDGLWVLGRADVEPVEFEKAPSAGLLRREGIWGALPQADYDFLKSNSDSARRLCENILVHHFPESIFDDIMDCLADIPPVVLRAPTAVTQQVVKPPRSPSFRRSVLVAYQHRCALCGFGLSLADRQIGVEAAHIQWHAMGGPGDVSNGLALCYQHHKLFDLGIFTLRTDLTIQVSRLANSWSNDSHRIRTGTRLVKVPEDEDERPAGEYLEWHRKNVFKN